MVASTSSCTDVYFCLRYFPCDPPYVTDELRDTQAFKASMNKLKTEMEELQNKMMNSVPFYSSRYKVPWYHHRYYNHQQLTEVYYLCHYIYIHERFPDGLSTNLDACHL